MSLKFWMAVGVIAVVAALGWAANHYHDKAVLWRTTAQRSQQVVNQQAATINDMTERQQQLAELDKTHTQNLANAKNHIAALQRDVAAGRKQLQLSARCPTADKPSGSGGLGNAATPELTADARRNYWRLRNGIVSLTSQVTYLQDYIRQQCLAPETKASQ